jgi:hypothetical protein
LTPFQVGDRVGFTYGHNTVWGVVHWVPRDGVVLGVTSPSGGKFSPSVTSVTGKTQEYA